MNLREYLVRRFPWYYLRNGLSHGNGVILRASFVCLVLGTLGPTKLFIGINLHVSTYNPMKDIKVLELLPSSLETWAGMQGGKCLISTLNPLEKNGMCRELLPPGWSPGSPTEREALEWSLIRASIRGSRNKWLTKQNLL